MKAGRVYLTMVELVVVGVLKVFWDTEENCFVNREGSVTLT